MEVLSMGKERGIGFLGKVFGFYHIKNKFITNA